MVSIEDIKDERGKLRKFITTYHCLPVLWDVKCLDYNRKEKRNKAYDILLNVFRTIKQDATVDDVKKKINSMRSNFRKELKKVAESASVGMNYRPSSWMYEELMFLKDLETPGSWGKSSSFVASEDNDLTNSHDVPHVDNDIYPIYTQYPVKRTRYTEAKQNDVHPQVCNSTDAMCDNEADIAKLWAGKLKYLDHMQRLFAEKAINDVLFEAQLGTLHRDSVKINEYGGPPAGNSSMRRAYHQRLEPSQSSPEYKFSETEVFRSDDN